MNHRSVMGVMVLAATLVSTQAVYAAPATMFAPMHAASGKTKLVKFTLRNDSSVTLKLKAGDSEMSLEPGKPMNVSLPDGQTVVIAEAAPGHDAGSVLVTVSSAYSGNTVAVR